MKKVLMIIGGIVVGCVILAAIILGVTYITSKKLVCKSSQGDITLMYDKDNIKGYTANKITYDLEGQQEIAKQIGIEEYLEQFKKWFSNNTDGTCK